MSNPMPQWSTNQEGYAALADVTNAQNGPQMQQIDITKKA